jgi:uncharacterized membrane protein YhaH (DUF805 family)
MTFPEAVKSAFKNYAKFDGRATRSEYWWFALFQVLVLIVVAIPMVVFSDNSTLAGISGLLYIVAALGMLLPALGLLFRRLHDTDRSAWWILLSLVPFGSIVLLVFTCLDSTPGPNKYGPRPGRNVADTFS